MASKKDKFEEWKKGKDYIMWTRLKEMCDTLDLTSSSFIGYVDLGGLYWEPLLELIYKYGNILKKTYKLKEIKMEYIRPLNYLGAQSDIEVVFDNDKYFVPKLASGKASQARFSFSHLIDSIRNVDNLNETNYLKECKTFKSDFNNFLKNLSSFVYEKDEFGLTGYRYLTENIKLILYPLRMLRKSAYRLFSVEKLEQKYQSLMTFTDKNDIKLFVDGVHQFLESEVYKQNKNCDVNELDKYMERNLNDESYKYKFSDKIHVEEKKVDKDDKGNPKVEDKKTIPKTLTVEEMEKIKNEEERKNLTLINIKKVEQNEPNSFIKKALQQDLEIGFDLMYKFLNKKIGKDYPFPIDTHKIFVNLYKIPKGREILQIEYYLGQLNKFIEELKLMSYEMKLNGLVRTLIPIQANTEYIAVLKKIYDMHNIIDRILGDKLLYDQYLFIYDMIKFIHDSSMKEDLELYKTKKFMEQNVPRYIFYMSMVKSANIFIKFQKNSRLNGGHFTIDQYYQPLKHEIDGSNNIALNAYEMNSQMKKGVSENYLETEKLFWEEVNKFGRFWLMEGYFPPEDRDKWLIAIESLSNINRLVQEDIRDMILSGNDEKYRSFSPNKAENEKGYNQNLNTNKKNTSSNKIINTDNNTLSDSSMNYGYAHHGHEKKTNKSFKRQKTNKRSNSKKGTNVSSKGSTQREKEKKTSKRHDSLDSTDKIVLSLPKNKNGLRPPFVWNFPIERIEEIRTKLIKDKEKIEEVHRNKNARIAKKQQKPKLDIVFKEEQKKNEIRKLNAYPYYHDGRIERFIDLFNELFLNCMKYAKTKGNTWEYVYCKILQVFGVEYIFSHPKEEEPEPIPASDPNAKNENKEGEKKEEKKEEEKENKENKEEEKKEEENKDEENKEEENKENQNQENQAEIKNENEKKEGEENKDNEEKINEENKNEMKEGNNSENENQNQQVNKQIANEEEKNQN